VQVVPPVWLCHLPSSHKRQLSLPSPSEKKPALQGRHARPSAEYSPGLQSRQAFSALSYACPARQTRGIHFIHSAVFFPVKPPDSVLTLSWFLTQLHAISGTNSSMIARLPGLILSA